MNRRIATDGVERELFHAWIAARSLARKVPAPVADHGGWRVDTASDAEICRYLFAAPEPGLEALGTMIDRPRIFLKLCAGRDTLAALLPDRWDVTATGFFMTGAGAGVGAASLRAGYSAGLSSDGPVSHVRILAADGSLAASGYAAEAAGVFAYDRIVTDAAHRRRGLGRAVMAMLGAERRSADALPVLVASPDGHALYTALGWETVSSYSTAALPVGEG
ncbi:GNAT family N-acetyltransferase [Stakelama marina]|uniref:GNAT family N-acetyltransferase n=1 Tax=Stakelama marina TaxID=2826939 RepID=A0A8T4IJ81_9SPHN|nr:GNAT family N-acetyltransferase [Stakelama marina]MBR0552379.1 GNAT family N-acetyltransferase [Stakelama marina]